MTEAMRGETFAFGEYFAGDARDGHQSRGRRRQRVQMAAMVAQPGPLAALDPDLNSGDRRRLQMAEADLPHPDELPLVTGYRAVGWSALSRIGWRAAMIGAVLGAVLAGALPIPVRVIALVGGAVFWLTLHRLGRPWISTGHAIRDFRSGLARAARNRMINRCAGRYLLREQLDTPAQRLLDRAAAAMATVRTSALATDSIIDTDAVTTVFGEQWWALAQELARQSRIRQRLDRVMAPFGERTAAVVDEQRAAVCEAEAASTAQVQALEEYADHVSAADVAYLDGLRARDLATSNGDACLELRAGIAGTAVRAAGLEPLVDQIRTIADAISAECHIYRHG